MADLLGGDTEMSLEDEKRQALKDGMVASALSARNGGADPFNDPMSPMAGQQAPGGVDLSGLRQKRQELAGQLNSGPAISGQQGIGIALSSVLPLLIAKAVGADTRNGGQSIQAGLQIGQQLAGQRQQQQRAAILKQLEGLDSEISQGIRANETAENRAFTLGRDELQQGFQREMAEEARTFQGQQSAENRAFQMQLQGQALSRDEARAQRNFILELEKDSIKRERDLDPAFIGKKLGLPKNMSVVEGVVPLKELTVKLRESVPSALGVIEDLDKLQEVLLEHGPQSFDRDVRAKTDSISQGLISKLNAIQKFGALSEAELKIIKDQIPTVGQLGGVFTTKSAELVRLDNARTQMRDLINAKAAVAGIEFGGEWKKAFTPTQFVRSPEGEIIEVPIR